MMRAPALLLLVGLLFLGLTPVVGQDADRGLIIEGNPIGEANLGSLNPLLCDDSACGHLTRMMFPWLLRTDPQTRMFAPATATDGLVESWTLDGYQLTFHLRADRTWSDGQPITAYDVYYSMLVALSEQLQSPYITGRSAIRAVAPVDATTFVAVLKVSNCDVLDRFNLPIIPAHVFDPNFADSAHFDGGDVTAWYDAQPSPDFRRLLYSSFNDTPTVTAGPFRFDSRAYDQNVRLVSADGQRAFEYVDSTDPNETVNRFLRGEINVLVDPPFERRQDIRAAHGVTVIERPGSGVYSIRLNKADPNHPASYENEDSVILDQGKHPLFSSPTVVHAMQLAIDTQALIDGAVEGNGVALAGSLPPSSWAYDGAQPVAYDPRAAARLLEEAGWKDTDGDGIRECISCTTAAHNTRLYFTLVFSSTGPDNSIASLIGQQLRKVGFGVDPAPSDDVMQTMTQQTFDAALVSNFHLISDAPDQTSEFTPVGDTLYSGLNTGSYNNILVTPLFDQALHVPGCNVQTRAGLYAQAQQVMRDDPPAIWLFSPNRMIAVRDDARTLQSFVEENLP